MCQPARQWTRVTALPSNAAQVALTTMGVRFAGQDPPQALADTMHRAWVDFATKGEPGWTRYDLDRRAVMRFDATPSLVDDPYVAERAMWAGLR